MLVLFFFNLTGVDAGIICLYLFGLIIFWIYLQECANNKVLLVSLQYYCDGEIQAIIVVLQFPPILSRNSNVNLLSL